ncbi:MAG: hypothetical protein R3C53_28785, partial [Pirellulaceae bacterium]
MSETTISFFPLDPHRILNVGEIAQIRHFLTSENSNAIITDSINVETFGKIQFIDCGSNLRRIQCAMCGDEIDNSTWQNVMNTDFSEDSGFRLETTLACVKCEFVSK